MSQIQSSIGLITGIPIQETVDRLIAVAGRPRDILQQRTNLLVAERTAVDQVSSLLLGFRFAVSRFESESIYSATTATSSDDTRLSVATSGDVPPPAGTYSFTPLQTASSQQIVSSSISDAASQLATGRLRIGVGGLVDRGISLSQLNSGSGVQAGSIRITDRSGESADIDLRTAATIDDVLAAINANSDIDVTATTDGDAIKLTDNTGGTGSLRVREVGSGTTAASLGLSSINVAADEATGLDLFTLTANSRLTSLNDGTGVRLREAVDDLEVTLADATVLNIDLGDATTLGDVVDAINAADPAKLTASIAADGNRLELTDLTSGATTFAVASAGAGTAAEDLGLTGTSAGGTLTGARLVAGLSDTLVSSLNGGQGFGTLGLIDIVDRAGNPAVTVDLSTAETLGQIVEAINASGVQVTASINDVRNGISLSDASGGSGNLVVASADATNTAESLGIVVLDAVDSVNSGSLNRQTVSEATRLDSLKGGSGISLGDFRITDSSGAQSAVSLNDIGSEATTIGDVIDALNATNIGIEARINDTGDGILITDTADGQGSITISEVNGGSTAADLRILGSSNGTNGSGQQTIDGSNSLDIDLATLENATSVALSSLNGDAGISLGFFSITNSAGDDRVVVRLDEPGNEAFTIDDVIDKINEQSTAAGINVTAALSDAGTGIRLTDTSGGDGTLTVVDLGSGTSAAELLIAGEGTTIGGDQVIIGQGLFAAQDVDQTRLDALANAINDFGGGFSASTFFDGNGFRLSVNADTPGAANELLIDSSEADFSFSEVARPQDAVLQIGNSATGGVIITSTDNTFEGIVAGLDLTIEQASDLPINVTVATDTSGFVDAAQNFVDSFNSLRDTLDSVTEFNAEALTTGLLFGRSEVLRAETDLAQLLSGRFTASAAYPSLESVGISLDDEGQLSLDTEALTEAFEANPGELQRLFTADNSGVVDRFQAVVDQLAGDEASVFSLRSDTLTTNIENNQDRIASLQEFLDRERERTLLEFFNLEETISRLQSNFGTLESIQPLAILGRRN